MRKLVRSSIAMPDHQKAATAVLNWIFPTAKFHHCSKWGCNNALLKRLKPGQSMQTRNGFVIMRSPEARWICPSCAGYYDHG